MGAEVSWSVSELGRACGLSVRVLRHWDAVGVVSPTRTAGGRRRYGSAEIVRLYRALALRRAGFGLARIAELLDDRVADPADALREHLAALDHDLQRAHRLRDRLAEALHAVDDHDPLTDDPTGSDRRSNGNGDDGSGAGGALMKVIASMTMLDGYVHGHRATEHSRLVDQAGTLTALLHADTGYPPGARVLEAGCGVGAQTLALAARSPGAHILAVDSSATALDQARQRVREAGLGDAVALRRVDLADLPHNTGELAAATFDHVFVCFVLEHLPEPGTILERLRGMLRPGGTLTVIEGDHGSAYLHPDSPAARDAIACQVTLQQQAGGDPLIGRRLRPLLADAGFDDIHVDPRTVYVDTDRPELVDGFTRRTFTAMIEGVREPAIAAGLTTAEHFDRGLADLQRTTADDGTFNYTFFKATAHRPRSQPT